MIEKGQVYRIKKEFYMVLAVGFGVNSKNQVFSDCIIVEPIKEGEKPIYVYSKADFIELFKKIEV